MASDDEQTLGQDPWFLKSEFPVLFPSDPALALSETEFRAFLANKLLHTETTAQSVAEDRGPGDDEDSFTVVSSPSTTRGARDALAKMDLDTSDYSRDGESSTAQALSHSSNPFMQALLGQTDEADASRTENLMRTENNDVAFRSTKSALLDLFVELEEVVSGPRLCELLNLAWLEDPLVTLKIIFNARSIHLGKSSKPTFYRCAGWLAMHHPLTLVVNLRWLARPVIEKKTQTQLAKEGGKEGKQASEDDMVIVEKEEGNSGDDGSNFDVRNGVAHGYWKDLLNILVLSVGDHLNVLHDPMAVLNTNQTEGSGTQPQRRARGRKAKRAKKEKVSPETAQALRHVTRLNRHHTAVLAFNGRRVHRALHLTVARLFAKQLKLDLAALRGEDAKAKRRISLCAKWAPSHNRFHDKHAVIMSTIAELLHPESDFSSLNYDGLDGNSRRTLYLRHARGAYTQDVAALRRHLEVVERDLSANTLGNIQYSHVPSIAMHNYTHLFARKDPDHFRTYIESVAAGKARISGAVLLPSTLIYKARMTSAPAPFDLEGMTLDLQWRSLVQRVRDSGTLENAIAVCDVSGSMSGPILRDGTRPLDSAIGLSLLLAEVTAPPFGGAFITFSANPQVIKIDLEIPLRQRVQSLQRASWGMNTDFVAVFERLILPLAVENKIPQEAMVKRVFVFSDMQFDQATCSSSHFSVRGSSWSSSYQRIQNKYRKAGYEMPELVFWNLAGGRAGYGGGAFPRAGDPVAPKPVTAEEKGVAMVSGYSQGMLKVFLEGSSFGEEEDEEAVTETNDGDVAVVTKTAKKTKLDSLSVMKRAIGHKAYRMLEVVD